MSLGKEIGKYMEEEQRKNGVNIHPQATIDKIVSENGKIKQVTLTNGKTVDVDFIACWLGSIPNTQFLKGNSYI